MIHDIISDILDWDEVQRVWTVAEIGSILSVHVFYFYILAV